MPDYMYGDDPVEINAGRPVVTMTVRNTGDRAVQIGSHYHFFEANRALSFDRERAYGRRLDIPAGTAVRIEAGDSHEVDLVEYGGGMRVVGFAGLVDGGLRSRQTHHNAMARMAEQGFRDVEDDTVTERPAGVGRIEVRVAKPATRSAVKSTAKNSAAGKSGSKPATRSASKPATRSASKPATKAASKPASKPASKAASRPGAKAAARPAGKSASKAAPKRTAASRTGKAAVTAKAPARSSRTRTAKKGRS